MNLFGTAGPEPTGAMDVNEVFRGASVAADAASLQERSERLARAEALLGRAFAVLSGD
jgi:hypothetical protein